MKALIKQWAHVLLGDYSPYYIYARSAAEGVPSLPISTTDYRVESVDETALKNSADALIREQAGYAGTGSHAYAVFEGERIVAVCLYWFGTRYLTRNFWPLVEGEAKLVQIVVHPDMRGRGIAPRLITASSQALFQQGYTRVYARIWHSNTPSLRAFERAGWTRIAFVLEINPFRRRRPIRIRLPA